MPQRVPEWAAVIMFACDTASQPGLIGACAWLLELAMLLFWRLLPRSILTQYALLCRMYAFDVHCNSYFPLFILLYGMPLCVKPGIVV